MPPLESMMALLALWTSWMRKGPGPTGKPMKVAMFDISRAHFYGTARRRVFVDLVDEDKEKFGHDKCGLLKKSMYGTQDASNIWQDDYVGLLRDGGHKRGVSNGAIFYKEDTQTRSLVHGDDFFILGTQEDIDEYEKMLGSRYLYKKTANLGFEKTDDKTAVFLNRVVSVLEDAKSRGVEVEPDSRHAELLLKDLGLEHAKAVETPQEKRSAEQQFRDAKSPLLDAAQSQQYRSHVMRAAYLAQDRPDLSDTTKSLARDMQTPREGSWARLKRLVRYST
jgi:hypothetical protein